MTCFQLNHLNGSLDEILLRVIPHLQGFEELQTNTKEDFFLPPIIFIFSKSLEFLINSKWIIICKQ